MYRCAAIRAKACSPARYPDSPAETFSTHKFKFNKQKQNFFRLRLTVYPVSAFQTGNVSIFKHQHRAQFLYQPIKFCLLFFLSEFGIVSGKAQPGSPGMVMESRKAAPALRARLLRSYVPLRRDPSESVLSGTIPGLPGGSSLHPQIQIYRENAMFLATSPL